MHTWIVLIRGINVGGRVLPMKKLVELMERAGCTGVRTYIQSGNAICKSKSSDPGTLATKIGKAILASEGYEPKVMILSLEQLVAAANANPYPTDAGKALHLFFLAAPPADPTLAALVPHKAKDEQYTLDGTTFYFYTPKGFGPSVLAAKFEKLAKVDATARNWNTVQALLELAAQEPAKVSPSRGTGRSARSKPAPKPTPRGRRKTRR